MRKYLEESLSVRYWGNEEEVSQEWHYEASMQRCIYPDLLGAKESSGTWTPVERNDQDASQPVTSLKYLMALSHLRSAW